MIFFKFELGEEMFELEPLEIDYMFSYLYRFGINNDLNIIHSSHLKLEILNLEKLRDCFFTALRDLLVDCYEEPSLRKRQKHPSFYEKVMFMDKRYVVNYTTSTLGRLIYTLSLRLEFIEYAMRSEMKPEISSNMRNVGN